MKKILTAIVCLISVASALAESGQFETVSGGIVTATTNDYGNSKYSITNVTYSTLVIKSNVSFLPVGAMGVSQCLGTVTLENSNASGGGSCLASDNERPGRWRGVWPSTVATAPDRPAAPPRRPRSTHVPLATVPTATSATSTARIAIRAIPHEQRRCSLCR